MGRPVALLCRRIISHLHEDALRGLGQDFPVGFAGIATPNPLGISLEFLPVFVGGFLTIARQNVNQRVVFSRIVGGNPVPLALDAVSCE